MDKKYFQIIDKNTFMYVKDLEHRLSEALARIESSRVGYMLVSSEYRQLKVLLSLYYESCKESHPGEMCANCNEYDRAWLGFE